MSNDTTQALMSRDDVLTIRWDRIVTRDDGTVWALCFADTGQPVALALDEEHAEALAGALLDGEDGEEVGVRDAEQAALSMRERALRVVADHRDELDGVFRIAEEIRALSLVDDDTDLGVVHAATPEGITPCGLGAWDVPAETDLDAVDCLECLRILARSTPAQEESDGLAQELDAAQVRVRELEEHFAATLATGKLRARILATIREVLDQPHHEDYRAGALTTAVMAKVRPLLNERNARVAELEERLASTTAPHRTTRRLTDDAHPTTEGSTT